MPRGAVAGLPHLRRQPDVAAQLLRRLEPGHVPNRGEHRRSDHVTHPGDGHQALRLPVIERLRGQHLGKLGELGRHTLELIHQPAEQGPFLVGQRQSVEPLPARFPKQVALVLRDEVGVEDRLDPALGSDQLLEDAHALGNLPPPAEGRVVRNPDLR